MNRFGTWSISFILVGLLAACATTIEDKHQQKQHPTPKEQGVASLPSVQDRASKDQGVPHLKQQALQVALLLPLSGARRDIGLSLKNAAEMALFDQPDQSLVLTFKDTGSTAEGAKAALAGIKQTGVDVVVGPVFSEEVKAIAPLLLNANLTVFTPSNDKTIANKNVSVMGFDPGDQIRAILMYAKNHDMHQVGVLLPSNAYGALLKAKIQQSAVELGLKDIFIAQYTPQGDDLGVTLDKLPLQNLDALLVVEGEKIALRASKYLEGYKDVSPELRLIGLSAFDQIKNPVDPKLVGLIYAGVGTSDHVAFENRYLEAFQHKPLRIASIIYDTLNLLSEFGRSHLGERITLQRFAPYGFEGVDGFLTVLANGQTERTFSILEITSSGVKTLIPGKKRT